MTGNARDILAVLAAGAVFACSPIDAGSGGRKTPIIVAPRQVRSADEATILVSSAIRSNKLTTLPDECIQYSVTSTDAAQFVVEVRENHRRRECSGDPETAPRLFDVRVDRNTGAMTTNANAAPDAFNPLPPSR